MELSTLFQKHLGELDWHEESQKDKGIALIFDTLCQVLPIGLFLPAPPPISGPYKLLSIFIYYIQSDKFSGVHS